MSTTKFLQFTQLEEGQAKAEVLVNIMQIRLDMAIHDLVKDKDLATPPASPMEGDAYIVAASPTGAWTGHATHVAAFYNGWYFIVPWEGLLRYVDDENIRYKFGGSTWAAYGGN